MVIVMIVEGPTEQAFMPTLRQFLSHRLGQQMPRIKSHSCQGRIPKDSALRRLVERYLGESDAVVALTDVYTGTNDFVDAADAKAKMQQWVGNNPAFFPHAAQYDFEAWLLPYWTTIQQLAKTNQNAPANFPESINHNRPPAHLLRSLFERSKRSYVKPRDATRILRDNDLNVSAAVCPELKALLNTLLHLSGGDTLS
jgi:Domain of unknown function (DUF4276)